MALCVLLKVSLHDDSKKVAEIRNRINPSANHIVFLLKKIPR